MQRLFLSICPLSLIIKLYEDKFKIIIIFIIVVVAVVVVIVVRQFS